MQMWGGTVVLRVARVHASLYPSTLSGGIVLPMALNIKNERTVALARELAHLQGTSITSAIEEALEARLAEARAGSGTVRDAELIQRAARVRELLAEIDSHTTDDVRERTRQVQADLYDDLGLPR